MGQSRLQSLIEAWANVLVGFGISMLVNGAFMVHHGCALTAADNAVMVGVFTLISIVRSYALRRMFNNWRSKNNAKLQPTDQ